MELTLTRRFKGDTYTIGTLYINGVRYCDTLEDRVRDMPREPKIAGKTAVPPGRYKVIVTMSPRFGRELPRLVDVPYFDGILIHRGNTHEDTAGCILVGENKIKGKVVNSTPYEIELTGRIKAAIGRGEEVVITVK